MATVYSSLLLFLLLHTAFSIIVVTPPTNQTVAFNSEENVTFTCNVSGSQGEAVWEVGGIQIQNNDNVVRTAFEDIGIFVNVLSAGVTEVVINSSARALYRATETPPHVVVRCTSFIPGPPPVSQSGDFLSIITFDAPSPPTDLLLTPNPADLSELMFMWSPPSNLVAGVEVIYHPSISGLSFNISNTTNDTFVIFRDDASLDCQTHTFSVFASNPAGTGNSSELLETIPISPDITALNDGVEVTQVSLTDPISLTLSIPLARSCSASFPIQNYSISIPSLMLSQQLSYDSGVQESPLVREIEIPQLEPDAMFEIFIETCISITCRQSCSLMIRTTDTQIANITLFENNIFMNCVFATNSNALGCVFQLNVTNGTESFFLPRSSSMTSQCNQTMNQPDAYEFPLFANDREADGGIGTSAIMVEHVILEDAQSYTSNTGCTIPPPESRLSAGAIAAIVIVFLIAGVVVICVVVIVVGVVYRVRTGHWFKIRERDEEKIVIHFEKELLMGDVKPIKRKSSRIGINSTDHGGAGMALKTTSPQPLHNKAVQDEPQIHTEAEEPDGSDATNPRAAFTLDISSDRKKVELHLNRALIRRMLQDKKINTWNRKKNMQRQTSLSKQRLVPLSDTLHCEVRVGVQDGQDGQSYTV